MKIQMIGHSRAGKTTYMAAMYKVMAEGDGYQLLLRGPDRLHLARLGDNLLKGYYPAETDVKSQYVFDFHYDFKQLFSFEWMDYRGGVLDGMMDDRTALREIDTCANQCDSMIVFIDSTTMNNKSGVRQWNHLANFILKFASRANEENTLSLTIILTKADLYNEDCHIYETLVGVRLNKMIDQLCSNPNLYGMLAVSEINKETFGNTFFSVLNAMGTPLVKRIIEEINRIEAEWKYYQTLNPNILDDITSWWKGKMSERQKEEQVLASLARRHEKLESLRLHIENMDNILREYDGKADYYLF